MTFGRAYGIRNPCRYQARKTRNHLRSVPSRSFAENTSRLRSAAGKIRVAYRRRRTGETDQERLPWLRSFVFSVPHRQRTGAEHQQTQREEAPFRCRRDTGRDTQIATERHFRTAVRDIAREARRGRNGRRWRNVIRYNGRYGGIEEESPFHFAGERIPSAAVADVRNGPPTRRRVLRCGDNRSSRNVQRHEDREGRSRSREVG